MNNSKDYVDWEEDIDDASNNDNNNHNSWVSHIFNFLIASRHTNENCYLSYR